MADRSVCVRRLKHADPSAQSQAWKVKLFVKDAGCIFFPRDLQKAIPARIDPEIDQHLMSKWLYTKLGFKLADLEDTDKQRLDIQGYLGTRLLYFTSDCFPGTTEETRFIIVESLDGDEVIVLCPSKKANNEAPALVNVTEALVFVVEDVERTPEEERRFQDEEARQQAKIDETARKQKQKQQDKRNAERQALAPKDNGGHGESKERSIDAATRN